MRRNYFALLPVLIGISLAFFTPFPVSAQGNQYGHELKEAGKEYGETIKKGFEPEDKKERAPLQKVGHAGKEFGKGTGNFFKNFGKSTGNFFKKLFVAE